jgi:AcrR family transcriptional regulator
MARYASPERDACDRVLQAAIHEFATRGLEKTTIDDIATQAGVSKGAVYFHYKNKNDLFTSALQMTTSTFLNSLESIASDPKQPASDRLELLIQAMFKQYSEHPEVFLLLQQATHPSICQVLPEINIVIKDMFAKAQTIATAVMNAGVQSGEFDARKAQIGSMIMIAMVNNPAFIQTMDGTDNAIDTLSTDIAMVLLDGIRKPYKGD